MSTFTRLELINQAATKVGALGAGQVLQVEDLDAFQAFASALFDQLGQDEILYISDESEIEASWCPYLASLLANLAAPDYGTPFSSQVKVENEAILRKLVRGKETFERQTPEYF